ncbi:hypothetical protein [endosymbiont of Lamellibrachia barhami]
MNGISLVSKLRRLDHYAETPIISVDHRKAQIKKG